MEQALSDLKVLDLTQEITGPYCTKLLADYGADVIKVEPPEGDSARRIGPFPGDIPHPEKSGLFLHLNTNKRSVTLNLKTATAQQIVRKMVKGVDLVVESFSPGAMASWGLDYPVLEKINPRLVMASITPFGQSGPYRDFQWSELVMAGMGGAMCTAGVAEREPVKYGGTVYQYQAGLLSLTGILAACNLSLWQGVGQYLDLSIMDMLVSNFDMRAGSIVQYQFTKQKVSWLGGFRRSPFPPMGVYPCQDGYMWWFPRATWDNVIRMLKMPDLPKDPRFATPAARIAHGDEIDEVLLSWMMARTRKQCWEEAVANDVICGPCNTVEDLLHDPHIGSRGFWAEVDHPALGKVTIPGRPFTPFESPWQLRRPAPLLGEHNVEVLGELGYAKEDLVKMSQAGVT